MREAQSSVDPVDAVRTARIGGNAAGVVEWADPAFAELTGIALEELAQKPVSRLLERVGIDLAVVDFVAERYFEGGVCRVEFPFERPDGAQLDVLLEVEPLRSPSGEIDRFVATAHVQPPRSITPEALAPGSPARAAHSRNLTNPPALPGPTGERRPAERARSPRPSIGAPRPVTTDLSQRVRRVAHGFADRAQSAWSACLLGIDLEVELDLAAEPLPIALEAELLETVVEALLDASCHALAESLNAGATITLSTHRAEAGRRFVSPAHAIPSAAPVRRGGPCLVLEVHDTGPMLAPDERSAPRRAALARARARLAAVGVVLEYETTPGCGNQALVLFELAP